tara:strand:+ start:40844 stop:40951 length:108 start_codon:yes stop_codon:yes gene_type:complete
MRRAIHSGCVLKWTTPKENWLRASIAKSRLPTKEP